MINGAAAGCIVRRLLGFSEWLPGADHGAQLERHVTFVSEHEDYLNCILRFSPYRAVNTPFRL